VAASARTSADAADRRLVGRTYAIPFAHVWDAALDLVRGELPRWHARWWDEEEGVIQALTRGHLSRRASDVVIRIGLDELAQTRVDLRSTSRSRQLGDFGSNTRLIGAFIAALDRKLTRPRTPPAPVREASLPEEAGGDPEPPADYSAPVEVAGPAVESDRDRTGFGRRSSHAPGRNAGRRGLRSRRAHARRGGRGSNRRPGYRGKGRSDAEAPAAEGTAPDAGPPAAEGSRASGRHGSGRGSRSRGRRGGRRGERR